MEEDKLMKRNGGMWMCGVSFADVYAKILNVKYYITEKMVEKILKLEGHVIRNKKVGYARTRIPQMFIRAMSQGLSLNRTLRS